MKQIQLLYQHLCFYIASFCMICLLSKILDAGNNPNQAGDFGFRIEALPERLMPSQTQTLLLD
jgi:hypothetical protein